ncbi:MAG: hypothetical protein M3464_14795 [Chloroflexota bacterium]|nr:hypothetical protein [Chloroflexota bacterium]
MAMVPDAAATGPSPADVQAQLRAWRAAHPRATFAEIEAAIDHYLAPVRTALLAEAAQAAAVPARPDCPCCKVPMQQVGQRQRTVRTAQDQAVTVQGPGYRCPACGAGLFPPGRGLGAGA